MKRLFVIAVFIVIPGITSAADSLTRRDGFLLIWQSVRRPAAPAKTIFSDLPETERGSLEIDFAANRNIIDDEDKMFRPDDSLKLQQALIWILRTRNVTDDPLEVNPETLPEILNRYPIAEYSEEAADQNVSEEHIMTLMHLLDTQLAEEDHEVSLYAEKFHGKGTAFGENFNMHAHTAAHRSFPHNTLVKVTNISNGKSTIVRINDRGPYVDGRDMDLSLAAFTSIEDRSKGKFRATFQRLGDVHLVGMCNGNSPQQQRIARSLVLSSGVPHYLALGKTLTVQSENRFVIRGITYPDGFFNRVQDFILEGESFSFKPSVEGEYRFLVGSIDGKRREMAMNVVKCD